MSSKPKWWFIVALLILCPPVFAQTSTQQQLPDAPSAKPLPNKPAPAPVPTQDAGPPLDSGAPANGTPAATQPDTTAGGTTSTGSSSASSSGSSSGGSGGRPANGGTTNPLTGETSLPPTVAPKPMPPMTRHTTTAAAEGNSRDELPVFTSNVNFVTVPVTVKDGSGHIVAGLLSNDFTVYENGVRQDLKYFTSDPFPLSAAVVVDMGLPEQVLDKVRQTLSALTGAFSPFDELSVYTYGTTVKKVSDFTAVNQQLDTALKKVKAMRGRNPGVPTVQGPMVGGPSINNMPVDPGSPHTPTVMHESNVLNDAVLAAALDLAKRDQAPHWRETKVRPRKILFLISDGREDGSRVSYNDVLKVLLSNEITVYAIGVGNAATPVYNKLQKFRIPGTNSSDYLPKYASATGGQVFNEFGQVAIEEAYSQVTSEARNQYTLGYTTNTKGVGAYRSIEVRVKRDKVKVFARDGYYPAPPLRTR